LRGKKWDLKEEGEVMYEELIGNKQWLKKEIEYIMGLKLLIGKSISFFLIVAFAWSLKIIIKIYSYHVCMILGKRYYFLNIYYEKTVLKTLFYVLVIVCI